MSIEYAVLTKEESESADTFVDVDQLARRFLRYLRRPDVQKQIAKVHKLGTSSAKVQEVVLPGAKKLGFANEKKGLFAGYRVPALRPDYYVKVRDAGVLLEVERGKTTTNNMDLLDFWKCHICEHADYLFLLVPQQRPSENGRVLHHFKQVRNRLSTFFEPQNYVDVDAVFLFGY